MALKLIASIGAAVGAEGRPLSVTPSIGVALYPDDGRTPEELVRHADSAMYRAKARGRANHQFFDRGVPNSAYAELVMEGQLAQALERGEFVLHFQPQVRADDGRPAGAEALIRWNHPQRGLLLADAFIPLAEQRQLMLPIGQWVLAEAARCALARDRPGGGAGRGERCRACSSSRSVSSRRSRRCCRRAASAAGCSNSS